MEEAYQCPNCGLPFPNDVICQQCGYRFARSGAGIRTSKLKLCVIAVAILTVLGLGMFLVGVPSEIRAVMRPVTVALVEIIDLLRGNDLGQFNHSGFSECVGCNLSGVDLTGADLSGANLRFANLTDADLTRANLTGANLFGTRLTGVDLNDANLTTANLTDAWLSGANLAAVNLSRVYLSGFNLSGKNLSEANLTDAWLVRADLTNANLTAAILVEADLTRANLDKADLTGADLRGADLSGANLDDVVGADFRGALNVPDKYLKDAGGKVDDVGKDVVSLLQQDNPKFCAECDLANADLTWADLSGVIGADFSGAKNAFP